MLKKRKSSQSSSKKRCFENTTSQRHKDYCGFVKSRVAKRTLPGLRGTRFLEPAWAKRSSEGCLFEKHENRKWHQKPTFQKEWCWDPLKTVPGSSFEKTLKIYEKTIGKSMFFDGLKPLKSIEKQTLFLILGHSKKRPNGTSKVMFWVPKWRHGLPKFDLSSDF